MNSDIQLKVQAYLDNELTPGEARQIANLLTSDSEARELYNELKQTKAIVAQNEPELRLPESRDFYWSKIQREIAKAEPVERPAHAPSWWMRLVAPMAGAVALFAVLLSISGTRSVDTPVTRGTTVRETASAAGPIHQGEVRASEMSAITFRSQLDDEQGVTLVWLASDAPDSSSALSWFDLFE